MNSHNLNVSEKNGSKVIDVEATEAANGSEPKTRKSLALKILALKCAAHLKWNFQLLENRYDNLNVIVCTYRSPNFLLISSTFF